MLRVYVAESPTGTGHLVACGAAWRYQLLPAFWLPTGWMGFLQWFYTSREWRGRGLASQIVTSCVQWLTAQGCSRVQLHASPAAENLYRRLGFGDSSFPNLWLVTNPPDDD